jgi:hypothetical protein
MASATVNTQRGHLRRQLCSGSTHKGHLVPLEKLVELWPQFLDLHITGVRPGRAVALLDVEHMLRTRVIAITSGAMDRAPGESATPRELNDAEVAAIEAWLAKYRAETPYGAAEIRATEVFFCYARRLQWSERSPLRSPVPHRNVANLSVRVVLPGPPSSHRSSILDSFRGTRFFRDTPRPP